MLHYMLKYEPLMSLCKTESSHNLYDDLIEALLNNLEISHRQIFKKRLKIMKDRKFSAAAHKILVSSPYRLHKQQASSTRTNVRKNLPHITNIIPYEGHSIIVQIRQQNLSFFANTHSVPILNRFKDNVLLRQVKTNMTPTLRGYVRHFGRSIILKYLTAKRSPNHLLVMRKQRLPRSENSLRRNLYPT